MRSRVTLNVRPTSSRVRGLAPVEAVAQAQDLTLRVAQEAEQAFDLLGEQVAHRRLERSRRRAVGDQIAELGVIALADPAAARLAGSSS